MWLIHFDGPIYSTGQEVLNDQVILCPSWINHSHPSKEGSLRIYPKHQKKNKKKTKRPRCLHVSYNQWRTVCIAAKMSCKSEAAPGGLTQQSAQFGLKCSPRREGSGSQITTSGTVSHFPPKTQKISCCALVEKGQMVEKAPRSPRQTQQCCLSCRHWSWSSNRKQRGRPSAGVGPWPYLWPCADIDDGPGLSDIFFWIKFCAKLSVLLQCGLVHDTHVFVHLITSDCGSNSDSLCQAF